VLQTGSLFLQDLHRRAHADGRLMLIETTAIAACAGALSGVRTTTNDWGLITLEFTPAMLWGALLGAGLWLIAGALLYHYARREHRAYIATLLVETGLLYLVLEHDPHETLPLLRRREQWTMLKPGAQANLSFRQRMLAFLRTYPACATTTGFHPYAAFWRWTERILLLGAVCAAAACALFLWEGVTVTLAGGPVFPLKLKLSCWLVLILILVRTALAQARRGGLWLALTSVLIGEVDSGRPVLTRI
jgi:hypothetical protein